MKKVLIDTNVLLSVFRYKIDIFSELERILNEKFKVYILEKTIEELKFIRKSHKKLKERLYAKMALEYINKNIDKIEIIKLKEGETDKLIFSIANRDWLVLTGDKKLKKKLKEKGVKTINIRQKKYLELEW